MASITDLVGSTVQIASGPVRRLIYRVRHLSDCQTLPSRSALRQPGSERLAGLEKDLPESLSTLRCRPDRQSVQPAFAPFDDREHGFESRFRMTLPPAQPDVDGGRVGRAVAPCGDPP